jgi:uncharacterized cupin superfamily protein
MAVAHAGSRYLSAMPTTSLVNWDDVPEHQVTAGDIAFARRRLGAAAGTARIGCSLYAVDPDARQMPVHNHGDEEEIFFVLAGDGLSWQDGKACSVGPGDTVVHRPQTVSHTFLAGRDGLRLLAFASGTDTGLTWLPRAAVMWAAPHWVPVDAPHPFEAEAAVGPLERPVPGSRPRNVVALADVARSGWPGGAVCAVGIAAGSVMAGLNHVTLDPEAGGAPLHCHALEEELFIVLAGGGSLTLGHDEYPLRSGDVVARPPSTGVAHALRAGAQGMTYLAYGTRAAGDSVYYPSERKVRLRGLGVVIDTAEW